MKTKRRGVLTIEVIIILPIVFSVIILCVDMLFIAHNRVVAFGEVTQLEQNLREHLSQSPDHWTLNSACDLKNGNIDNALKTSRKYKDIFHLGLSGKAVAERATAALGNSSAANLYSVEQLDCSYQFDLFGGSYIIDYTIRLDSPLKAFTHAVFDDYSILRGRLRIPVKNTSQQMAQMAIMIDRIEQVEEIETLLKTVRGVLIKWLQAI